MSRLFFSGTKCGKISLIKQKPKKEEDSAHYQYFTAFWFMAVILQYRDDWICVHVFL
jgi:hypothetical protein